MSGLISKETLDEVQSRLTHEIDNKQKGTSVIKKRPAYGLAVNERVMYLEEIFPLKKYTFEDYEFGVPETMIAC